MRKMWMRALVALWCLCLCSGALPGLAQEDGVLTVVTSFYPMYDFAVKIGGERVQVQNLVPAGVEPHDWEPSAVDMVALSKADVFIYHGAGMEGWAAKVIAALGDGGPMLVETSAALTLETLAGDDGHGHEHDLLGEQLDPHTWLDIQLAKEQLAVIERVFTVLDPGNGAYYAARYESWAEEFDALDGEYFERLAGVERRTIVVSHAAFGYLCRRYGLTQMGIEGLAADSEPDPARMAEIITFARENDVTTIFFEDLVSPKVAKTIAQEVGAQVAQLNPLEGLTQEQLDAGEDYLSIMRANLDALTEALK